MRTKTVGIILIAVLSLCLVLACAVGGYFMLTSPTSPIHITFGQQQTPSQPPSQTSESTPLPLPTYTALPTYTPPPTFTPLATFTTEPTIAPTYTPYPTYTKLPTLTPVHDAMFTASEPAFCRQGPSSQIWWDPKEALKQGQTVKIIGKSTSEWGLWWLVQKDSGQRCWVYSELGTTSGNVSGVPVVAAPVTPTPTILTVHLRNNHDKPLCHVWIQVSGSNNWVDLLNENQLLPGSSLSFNAYPGWYDVEIYQCPDDKVDVEYNFQILPGKTHFTTP